MVWYELYFNLYGVSHFVDNATPMAYKQNNRIHHKTKEHIMKKETLQEYLNKQVKVIDVLQNEVVGTLINLTDDSLMLQTSRNNVVISYDYVVQFLVKNSI